MPSFEHLNRRYGPWVSLALGVATVTAEVALVLENGPVAKIRRVIMDRNLYDELLAKALRLGAEAVSEDQRPGESGVVVEG